METTTINAGIDLREGETLEEGLMRLDIVLSEWGLSQEDTSSCKTQPGYKSRRYSGGKGSTSQLEIIYFNDWEPWRGSAFKNPDQEEKDLMIAAYNFPNNFDFESFGNALQ